MEGLKGRLDAIYEAITRLKKLDQTSDIIEEIERLEKVAEKLEVDVGNTLEPWDKVLLARKIERPRGRFYIEALCEHFMELHGDRAFGDDPAIVGGIGVIEGRAVTIIVQSKGNTAKENVASNFGMSHPEGYHKALRLMKQAEKFNRPIICLIDTPGAYCGIGAEERGQGEAIARNLFEMSQIKVPIISGVIGEGGSGGALALGVADKVFMQENAIYSVLSPEGFASILWKDASRAKEAACKMKLTAEDLLGYGIIDDIILEPSGGAHKKPEAAADALKQYLVTQLNELEKVPREQLINNRYERFRKFGIWKEE
ncbi:MAG: acetyl-CoA carboxylase carboxyltransferase subunit alpha [Candidatus Cellulosilyticum pullistercoris]|uniref:Acetyl-coenzyme A carboxylase carboxyl transferase subunit alpha n=1 Tax=Candidatus Cellulosilyticum pullistercoris TaxID=2838521 RepID=A0A9E2NLN2_9FIRM|nr:acetyl-CoA carboxylase carboxyltransferase subunit alpha [Candidatus Cellulosilyticum pullistercoris]